MYVMIPKSAALSKHQLYCVLLYEAIQDESAELYFIFRSARSVLYFPPTAASHLALRLSLKRNKLFFNLPPSGMVVCVHV